jgi:hypothetical protein
MKQKKKGKMGDEIDRSPAEADFLSSIRCDEFPVE